MPLLIYAFKDNDGRWHGDPDIPLFDPDDEPSHGELTYQPVPGTPEAASPFNGHTLTVLYGVIDLDPGPVTYQLDTGGRFMASWHVHTLLAAPRGAAPYREHTPGKPETQPSLETAFTRDGHRYTLTGTHSDDGQLTVELTVTTSQGEIRSELCGAVHDTDLEPLARLLDAASHTPAHRCTHIPSPPHPATSWTEQESSRLAARFRHERNFKVLAAEFGRSSSAVYDELVRQQLIRPRPQSFPTSTPAPTPAPSVSPIMQQRRALHRNSHARWSDEDDQMLAQRCAEGATNAELCDEFGRSSTAIEARLLKVGATGPAADEARNNQLL
ncbi:MULTISPECIES: hypothetical protein [unclassified Streptomyces]|uniref:hypothetical protein n=1 Tax=unclassified Streptomyces TaxID=2593676 RepID=UPI000DAD7518|nr:MULTISPECIES: hypothetical protein [unclassified Streptomyces]PZT71595.1 hypothetical protein DNK55_30980 [Streptomyces sp. AC1-42T]PZT73278.1 hypothetical protein DNK56_34095 [Streptomyces sp. AC1-42W]